MTSACFICLPTGPSAHLLSLFFFFFPRFLPISIFLSLCLAERSFLYQIYPLRGFKTQICQVELNEPSLKTHSSFFFFYSALSLLFISAGEKSYLCDLCGFAGGTKHALTKHRRQHTGKRAATPLYTQTWGLSCSRIVIDTEIWTEPVWLYLVSRSRTRARQRDTALSVIGMCTSMADWIWDF